MNFRKVYLNCNFTLTNTFIIKSKRYSPQSNFSVFDLRANHRRIFRADYEGMVSTS